MLVVGAVMLAGCSTQGQAAATGSQVAGWMTSSAGGAAIGQTAADSRNIGFTIAHHDPASAVRAACALLTTDALTAIGNLPTPDNALTDDLNNAYQTASAAGDDCYKGATGNKVAAGSFRIGTGQVHLAHGCGGRPLRDDRRASAVHVDHPGLRRLRRPVLSLQRWPVTSGTASEPDGDDAYDRLRRRVLWSMPTGLFVVGSRHGDRRNLMTANWVMQVATDAQAGGGGRRVDGGDAPADRAG